jgi:hypothetical protein
MDRWVFSTALSSSQRGDHSAFDSSKSETWEEYEGATWDISYGDGSGASGTVGFDQVDVGGVTATRQAVEIATTVSSAFVSDENNDGLLGLAFGKINTIQPTGQKTFFESVADQLEEKAFTADLDVDAAGTYEFGRIDTEKYQGELHTTPNRHHPRLLGVHVQRLQHRRQRREEPQRQHRHRRHRHLPHDGRR